MLGRRLWLEVPSQTRITYAWDAASRLTQIQQGDQVVTFNYDSGDRRTLLTLPNGASTEYQYEAASRPAVLIYRNALAELGRLTYTYDTAGNRARVGGSFAATLLPSSLESSTYDAANRQIAFGSKTLTYDDDGNLTQILDGTDATLYNWDSRGQLMALSAAGGATASFTYDAFGRRASKTINGITTQFQYDGLDIAREIAGGIATGYLMGPGLDEALARGLSEFYLADTLGSIVRLTDSTGIAPTAYRYEPFGRSSIEGTTSANAFDYTGRENDVTGVQYYRSRYYSPQFQRFISEDPLGFAGGDVNLYAYVANAPTTFRDPLGLVPTPVAEAVPRLGNISALDCSDSSSYRRTPGCEFGADSGGEDSRTIAAGMLAESRDPADRNPIAGGASRGRGQSWVGQTSRGRTFVVTPSNRVIPIPEGWQSRTADNGKGIVFQKPGSQGNADMIRIMDPGADPRYPNGYLRYYNQYGQPLDRSGRPGDAAATHIPFDGSSIPGLWFFK
jgi:RHS repeat-associated protein